MRTVSVYPLQGSLLVDLYDKWACLATLQVDDTLKLASIIEQWINKGKCHYVDLSTGEIFDEYVPDATE